MFTRIMQGICRVLVALVMLAAAAGAAAQGTSTVVEFHHGELDHYFVTAEPAEAAAIDAGTVGRGWARTGRSFAAWSASASGLHPVCRFFGTPGVGPNSHFFTADPAECSAVRADPRWVYEGVAFHARLPEKGACASGDTAVHRLYNNRADTNHRYVTDAALRAGMTAQGCIAEGVVFCTPATSGPGSYGKYLTFSINVQDYAYPEL